MVFRKKSIIQQGFGSLELLLILVIVALLGFVGWYVFHSKSTTQDNLNSADVVSSDQAVPAASSPTFTFKEIGVKIPLPADLKGLSYSLSTTAGTQYLLLTTPEFTAAVHKCDSSTVSKDKVEFASISKVSGQYNEDDNPTVGNLKQFDDFWISTASPNGIVCDDSATQQTKDLFTSAFHSTNSALVEAFKSATEVK